MLHLEHADRGFEEYAPLSWLRYDEVAVPNIAHACADLGIRSTFFLPGWCIERYTAMCETIVAGGHELALHGYLHERPNSQIPEAELALLQRSTEAIVALTGRRSAGWRAPHASPSQYSLGYLVSEGFLYDSSLANDHDPFIVETAHGSIVELPIEMTMSDWPHYAYVPDLAYLMPPKSPASAIEYYMAEFEATYEIGGFLTTIWHPHVSGRPSRLLAWHRWIETIRERPDVWITTLEEIAAHVRHLVDSGEFVPRRVQYPLYDQPVQETADVAKTYRTSWSPGRPE
jgi:peptidoglycan/xylan/chitin deacetylase (PgdA/CDA1 family)